jgi:signal transduction histidine kinase
MQTLEQISDQHSFSRDRIETAAGLVATKTWPKRLLIGLTQGHRKMAKLTFQLTQGTVAIAVPMLMLVEWNETAVSHRLLLLWCGVAAALFVFRWYALRPVFSKAPAVVAATRLRIVLVLMVLSGAAFWAATTFLFMGRDLRLSGVFLIVTYLALTISMTAMAPSSPIAAIIYVPTLWISMFIRLAQMPDVSWRFLLPLAVLIGVCLLVTLFIVLQVNWHLDRADRVDLLTANLLGSNGELENVRTKLAATIRRRSTFFAATNHDFRQRLHALKVLSAISLSDKSLSANSLRALRMLSEQIQNLDLYLTDILDFARIEVMEPKPELRECSLMEILQDVNLHFEALAQSRGVDLRVRLTRVTLATDPAMLQRIVENLVSNALKFTRSAVLVSARAWREGLRIEVWDQGPGIPAEALDSIFEAFRQREDDKPIENHGVGLGLAVVKRFAEALGYEVSVRSTPGHGSVFRIAIPPTALSA